MKKQEKQLPVCADTTENAEHTDNIEAIYLGDQAIPSRHETIEEKFVSMEDDSFYSIRGFDNLKPFFMSLASPSDHYLFISSRGGLSAGRRNPDNALFPYVNVDQIHFGSQEAGSKTYILCEKEGKTYFWQPFSKSFPSPWQIVQTIYKNVSGSKVVFEEFNRDLGIEFRYSWTTCDKFGFVKEARVVNHGTRPVGIRLLDGLRNILPRGVTEELYLSFSSLTDAYKLSEVDPKTGLGIFSLTAEIHDGPCPKEMLHSTVAWHCGFENSQVLLSDENMDWFLRCETPPEVNRVEGSRAHYGVYAAFDLEACSKKQWMIVADVAKDHEEVAVLHRYLTKREKLIEDVARDVDSSRRRLDRIVCGGDGLQTTGSLPSCVHHRTNVLFNVLRGGLFLGGYNIDRDDFLSFLEVRNKNAFKTQAVKFRNMTLSIPYEEFLATACQIASPDIERLAFEYLPLAYSRRHGDPSRPWNKFDIDIRSPEGNLRFNYEGNWRDIFQNWEALARSYPAFVESFIAKFVNASTVDGYNPYRLDRNGFDWERVEQDKAWSNIGYWGDHQVIYILKFLELYRDYFPESIFKLLEREIFSYGRVPYRIVSFSEMVKDPKTTVTYDDEAERDILSLEAVMGADAKLVQKREGGVYHVCLFEKLLLLVLSKMSNLVPDGGIWMNTGRPEWNDANNALAGYGLSVVTVCHLKKFLHFFISIIDESESDLFWVSSEVATYFEAALGIVRKTTESDGSPEDIRNSMVVHMGNAASEYRKVVYEEGFSGKTRVEKAGVREFLGRSLGLVERTIRNNKREDGLYHSYNILDIERGSPGPSFGIVHLQEMLEGQVAALSSGILDGTETVLLLGALKKSALFDETKRSYMLYPDKRLPGFMEKNRVPSHRVLQSRLLANWDSETKPDQIVYRDDQGTFRFRGKFKNGLTLSKHLDRLKRNPKINQVVCEEEDLITKLYDEVFSHRSYTGRSGSMFAYEGLGSVYWHMVSKLLYEVLESYFKAADDTQPEEILNALHSCYRGIRDGLGYKKSAKEFGAFPTDPYSHSPKSGEARQPGMTGQVKEGILLRMGELGVRVRQGKVMFLPRLTEEEEYLSEERPFSYWDIAGNEREIVLPKGSLGFMFCGVPIIYMKDKSFSVEVYNPEGVVKDIAGSELDAETSRALFLRNMNIEKIVVKVS